MELKRKAPEKGLGMEKENQKQDRLGSNPMAIFHFAENNVLRRILISL